MKGEVVTYTTRDGRTVKVEGRPRSRWGSERLWTKGQYRLPQLGADRLWNDWVDEEAT